MDTYLKAPSSSKRHFSPHPLTPLHPMAVNVPSPRLRLSLSRNSLISIGAVSPTNITSLGRNHNRSTEQLTQNPFTNDHDRYHVDQDAPHPCSIPPIPKTPHVYNDSHPDNFPRVTFGCNLPSKFTLQHSGDASDSSVGDSDTYVVGYTESEAAYDAVAVRPWTIRREPVHFIPITNTFLSTFLLA